MVSIRGWLLETLKQDDTLINAEAKAKTLFFMKFMISMLIFLWLVN